MNTYAIVFLALITSSVSQYKRRGESRWPVSGRSIVTGETKRKCFLNDFGFQCCNRELLKLMVATLKYPTYSPCNLQAPLNQLQNAAQNRFGMSFEGFVAPDSVIIRGRFRGGLMCKVRTPSGKVALLYATAVQYTTTGGAGRPLTNAELAQKNWGLKENRIDSF